MKTSDGNPFNILAADTAISFECEGIDYVFASHVVGRLKQWLVITRDPAMEAFEDQIKPGCRLDVRFIHQGRSCRMEAYLKRMISGGAKPLVIDRPGAVETIERRQHPRHDCHLGARMEIRRQAEVTIVNINAKGCRLRIPWGDGGQVLLREQDRVSLEIRLPGEGRIVPMTGEIRNLVQKPEHVEAGILFEASSSGLADILASLDEREDI